jgi:phosphatidate cytidylyltransferase
LFGGVLALAATWLAVAQAKYQGVNFLLSVLLLVWVADIFAYFAGRAFAGKLGDGLFRGKLAPSISPGKSWAGVWGGVLGVLVLAAAWSMADLQMAAEVASLYTRLLAHGMPTLLLGSIGLTAMSVVGDLVESLVKRSAGFKDSSNLLPGHGGVLDRVDALLPVLPMAMALVTVLA